MSDFVSLAIEQGLAQRAKGRLRGQLVHLLLVMVVDKGLNCLDGCVDRFGAEQRRQGASEKPGQSPQRKQTAVVYRR